jgi:hypothetical protein
VGEWCGEVREDVGWDGDEARCVVKNGESITFQVRMYVGHNEPGYHNKQDLPGVLPAKRVLHWGISDLCFSRQIRLFAPPTLELLCLKTFLKHPINLAHTPTFHLRDNIPAHQHCEERTRGKHVTHLAPEVALIRIEFIWQHEARDSASERRHEPAYTLCFGAEL